MAASQKTVDQIIAILRDELDDRTLERITQRLVDETTGNSSYRDTVLSLFLNVTGHYPGRMPSDRGPV